MAARDVHRMRENLEDSDSSDGTNPATPRKNDRQSQTAPTSAPPSGLKQSHVGQISPYSSPTRPQQYQQVQQVPHQQQQQSTGPSPKRTLFSRPSKMSMRTDAKDTGSKDQLKENNDTAGSSNPGHYFAEPSSHHQSFSTILKHAGSHVHPHLHSNNTKPQQSISPLYGALPRGKSFDMLRAATGDASYAAPISPSFFSSTGRSASFSAFSPDQDDNWPLICARVLPLFNGEGLRQPIEDLNRLVSTHLRRLIERHEQSHLVEDLTELFDTGTRSLDNNLAALPDEKLVSRLSEIWVFYFSTVLPYLEATFLPITIEFANSPASYFSDPSSLHDQSFAGTGHATTASSTSGKATGGRGSVAGSVSIHSLACKSYRDILILPLHSRLLPIFTTLSHLLLYQHGSSTPGTGGSEVFGRLLQCVSVLRRVQSGDEDEKQRKCDELGKAAVLYKKGRGDRRGIIGERKNTFSSGNSDDGMGAGLSGSTSRSAGKWSVERDEVLGEVIGNDESRIGRAADRPPGYHSEEDDHVVDRRNNADDNEDDDDDEYI